MAHKGKFSKALWQEWQNNPKATAEHWGINWSEWESTVGKRDWNTVSYNEFESLLKKSRWSNLWDWTA